jgi:hypothetical protein
MIKIKAKYLLLLNFLLLNSCSLISYNQAIPLIKNAVIGVKDIEITDEFYNNINYSFAKLKIGRSAIAILSLVSIENEVYEWVSETGEKVYTYKGKIFKTEGITYNLEIINFRDFVLTEGSFYISEIILDNPLAYTDQNTTITISKRSDLTVIYENINTASFRWNFDNKYWLNNDSKVIRSVQTIHPKLPKIEIDYYYKY